MFVFSYLESKSSEILKNKLINIVTLLLIFFFGLRGFIQSDFQNYYPWFDELLVLKETDLKSLFVDKYEFGFVFLTVFCKSIWPDYFMWIFLSSLIDIVLLRKIFKDYSVNVCLSFAIYFAIGAIIMEFNLMRNIKAILILFLSLRYIKEKKMWNFFLCVFVASLFHITSIIFVPLYFILDKRWSKKVLLVIFVVCISVLLFRIRFLSIVLPPIASMLGGKYNVMFETYYSSGMLDASYGISFGLIERVITFFLVYYFYDVWEDKHGNKYIFPNMVIIYFMCFSLLAEMSVLLERLAYYFALSYCVFYPNLLKKIRLRNNRLLICCFIFFIFTLKVAQQTRTIVCKYDNLLFGIESFEERLITLNYFNANVQ